ncbi:hypothetical protein BDF14DRAFT_1860549 [Spinellus fusiger]|nr:hypothetical protein BDF14DRAFT_1860549 [Spinellus fusiger]
MSYIHPTYILTISHHLCIECIYTTTLLITYVLSSDYKAPPIVLGLLNSLQVTILVHVCAMESIT